MRGLVILLLVILGTGSARAQCPADVPPAETSSARSLSEAPYDKSAPPCPAPASAPARSTAPDWSLPVSQERIDAHRIGFFTVGLGAMILLVGTQFAVCAQHSPDPGQRDFCRSARAPTLLSGSAVAALGIGLLTYVTLSAPAASPRAAFPGATLSVGLAVR